jgi:hypothetical protein
VSDFQIAGSSPAPALIVVATALDSTEHSVSGLFDGINH